MIELEGERRAEGRLTGTANMPLASNPEIQHETMKNLDLDERTKEMMGFVDLTEEEKLIEEERKEALLANP